MFSENSFFESFQNFYTSCAHGETNPILFNLSVRCHDALCSPPGGAAFASGLNRFAVSCSAIKRSSASLSMMLSRADNMLAAPSSPILLPTSIRRLRTFVFGVAISAQGWLLPRCLLHCGLDPASHIDLMLPHPRRALPHPHLQ